jgi:hypothetical protein
MDSFLDFNREFIIPISIGIATSQFNHHVAGPFFGVSLGRLMKMNMTSTKPPIFDEAGHKIILELHGTVIGSNSLGGLNSIFN